MIKCKIFLQLSSPTSATVLKYKYHPHLPSIMPELFNPISRP
jgi:hypothetical protein